jgi:hypothetical protein
MERRRNDLLGIFVINNISPISDFLCEYNRGADRRRVLRKQAELVCVVRGVRSSTLFWRVATAQGA